MFVQQFVESDIRKYWSSASLAPFNQCIPLTKGQCWTKRSHVMTGWYGGKYCLSVTYDIKQTLLVYFFHLAASFRALGRGFVSNLYMSRVYDDVSKRKHFPRYWPFVRGIHRSSVNSPHKGQWRGALMFTLICARINGWVNNREAGDLRCYRTHYDVIVM